MDCEELINLFYKVGGVLTCDYVENKAYIANTNLKCKIKPKHYEKFTMLLFEFGCSPYEVEHLKYNSNKTTEHIKYNIDTLNRNKLYTKYKNHYLSNNEYGYKITYIDK